MGMLFGDIFCCYPFSLDFVQRVGPGTSTPGLHSCIPLLSVRVSSLCSPGPSLCLTKHGIRAFVFLFEFFIAQKSSMHRIRERGVCMDMEGISRNGFGYVINFAMDSPTFSSTSRSACFGDLHASTSAHHDVYTGGRLLRIMQHCQARTSTYGFLLCGILLGTTLFI